MLKSFLVFNLDIKNDLALTVFVDSVDKLLDKFRNIHHTITECQGLRALARLFGLV